MKKLSIIFAMLLLLVFNASAQEPKVTVTASKNPATMNDTITVSFIINNQAWMDFNGPPFVDFSIIQGPYKKKFDKTVNGKVIPHSCVMYDLVPSHNGKCIIPKAEYAMSEDHRYYNDTLVINVMDKLPVKKSTPKKK